MHFFGSSRDRSPRFFAHFNLPENPICWAKGHTPKGKIVYPTYSDPYLIIRCKVCDRRHASPNFRGSKVDDKELIQKRLEVFQREPKMFNSGIAKRGNGWSVGKLELNFEGSFPKKPLREFSFRLHTGTRSSESPYDAHFTIAGYGVYLGVGGLGGRWAEFIGQGHGRDISLSMHNGSIWWKLWYDGNSGNDEYHSCDSWRTPKLWPWSAGRRKHRSWMCLRDGNIDVNPVSAFYGKRKWLLVEQGVYSKAVVDIGQFEGDSYIVKFRIDRRNVMRDSGPKWARRIKREDVTVEWDAYDVGGIPIQNHKWKGDEVTSGNLSIDALSDWDGSIDWIPLAVEGLKNRIIKDRIRYEYRPPIVIKNELDT